MTELAIVICSPSRIHAAPSPATIRVWNGDHPSRSRRAGTVVRIGACAVAELAHQQTSHTRLVHDAVDDEDRRRAPPRDRRR